ncbi:sensor domain-containing diguanylate cyclase [soil metagenome]
MDGNGHAMSARTDGAELTRLLASLAQLTRLLADVRNLPELLELSGEHMLVGLRSATVSLSRLEPGTGTLRTVINVGDLGPREQRWPSDETYNLQDFMNLRGIVSERQMWTVTADDPQADAAELALLRELGKPAALAAPLIVSNTMWGEVYVTYAEAQQALTADHAYLEVYLAIVESALARVQQIQSLERLAYQDPMTGLANRRALDEAAAAAFATLDSPDMNCVTLVAFDLNGLKQVNDQLGHPEGDRLITSAAALIKAHFDPLPGSLAARVGGDEFVVLVPVHHPDSVIASALHACSAVAELPLGTGASCGIASTTGLNSYSCVSDLFRSADSALYRSKMLGRLVAPDSADLDGLTA